MFLRYTKYIRITKLTIHACKRFWEYTTDTELGKKDWTIRRIRKLVSKAIAEDIRKGLVVDSTGAFHVPLRLGLGLYAAVLLVGEGFLVVTVHKNERNIDIDKLREQKLAKEVE
jgi:hypothetical protein